MELIKYEAACRAVEAARTIDEVKEITNRAEAARAYAKQAKNRGLELNALEIRVRAERRLGEILLQLREDGAFGQGRGGSPVKLEDLGVDRNISGGAQRLAKLPAARFSEEMTKWRDTAETSTRVEVPLQRFRIPSIVGDRQRAATKLGRNQIDEADPLDRFKAMDGRRVADWRAGELDRLDELAARVRSCVSALRQALPMANPDPLDTMEMIFDRASLVQVLESAWDRPIAKTDTGVDPITTKDPERRICARCSAVFIIRGLHKKRPYEGKFCSRSCAGKAQHSRKCGTSAASTGPIASNPADR